MRESLQAMLIGSTGGVRAAFPAILSVPGKRRYALELNRLSSKAFSLALSLV